MAARLEKKETERVKNGPTQIREFFCGTLDWLLCTTPEGREGPITHLGKKSWGEVISVTVTNGLLSLSLSLSALPCFVRLLLPPLLPLGRHTRGPSFLPSSSLSSTFPFFSQRLKTSLLPYLRGREIGTRGTCDNLLIFSFDPWKCLPPLPGPLSLDKEISVRLCMIGAPPHSRKINAV